MPNKQTAVEWLIDKVDKHLIHLSMGQIFKQAKEMEKQQMIDAWMNGAYSIYTESAEKYYNEEYAKNTNN